jgi:hypothetical protein
LEQHGNDEPATGVYGDAEIDAIDQYRQAAAYVDRTVMRTRFAALRTRSIRRARRDGTAHSRQRSRMPHGVSVTLK